MQKQVQLRIGDFVLDPSRNLLTSAEGDTALEPKVVDVLMALAAQPGMVLSRDQLIEAVWKAEFGADERLTRAISLLRKAFHDERGTPRYIETVPKRGYRLVAAVGNAASGPPSAEESTAAANVVEATRPAAKHDWRTYAGAGAMAALMVAVVMGGLWRSPTPKAASRGSGVLELHPLVAIDPTAGMTSFGNTLLAAVKRALVSNHVVVIDAAPAQAAPSRQSAEFNLTGTLEQFGDSYAVTVFLSDRAAGQTLWSRKFVRPVAEGAELNEEVGTVTASILACGLQQRGLAVQPPSPQVLQIYFETCDPEVVWDAMKLFAAAQRLVAVAPKEAYANGLVATSYEEISSFDGVSKAQAEAYQHKAREHAARALALDPTNPLSRLAAAVVTPSPQGRWSAIEAEAELAASQHPVVRNTLFFYARTSGRLAQAGHIVEQMVAATPLSAYKAGQAVIYMHQGNYQAADRLFDETLRIWPELTGAHWYRFINAALYGDPQQALKLLQPTSKMFDWDSELQECWHSFIESRTHGRRGDQTKLRSLCEKSLGQDYTARMMTALGDVEGAYALLGRHRLDSIGSTVFAFYPEMAPFRADRRFMSFIAPSGLVKYWSESGNWPDFCADKSLTYDCKEEAARALMHERANAH